MEAIQNKKEAPAILRMTAPPPGKIEQTTAALVSNATVSLCLAVS